MQRGWRYTFKLLQNAGKSRTAQATECFCARHEPQCATFENTITVGFKFQTIHVRHAGHSKWANIRHTKAAKDGAKSLQNAKFVKMIQLAIRENGSPDPKKNSRLAEVISQAKGAKIPMATIERTLENHQKKKEAKPYNFPIKGPGGSLMIVEVYTDNVSRSKQDISAIIKKSKGLHGEDSILRLFNHKGVIISISKDNKPANESAAEDEALEDAIDSGAEEVNFEPEHPDYGPCYEFITSPSAFFKVKQALEQKKYDIVHNDVVYFPQTIVDLDEADLVAANNLYDKLRDYHDTENIYVNYISDSDVTE